MAGWSVKTVAVAVEGGVRVHLDMTVDARDLKDWSPDRIDEFFAGVAQTVRATVEKAAGPSPAEKG